MTQAAFIVIAVLLVAAIGVQVRYAQSFLRAGVEVGVATKIVWAFNIVLLTAVVIGLMWYLLQGGVS